MPVNAETSSALPTSSFDRVLRIFQPAPTADFVITEPAEVANEYRRWQRRVLASSIIGYATFYFVRKNLSIAMPVMERSLGIQKTQLGWRRGLFHLRSANIHIALSPNANPKTDECSTVTAEISPHYRPAVWSRFHDGQNPDIEALIPGLLKQQVVENQTTGAHPFRLRLTGPLFYDASHRPCVFSGGKVAERHAPERRSIWEIHPIHRIEVYDSMKQRWLDLDRWAERR